MKIAALAAAAAVSLSCGTAAAADPVPVPTLLWTPCPPAPAGSAPTDGLLCADAIVPVDHALHDTGTFTLAVIKHPATDTARKIGTLFWNPGGPGDAGTQYLPAALGDFPEQVRARFDIVSWDPRGMGGRTTPVIQCFDTAEQEDAFTGARLASLPVTAEEMAADAGARTAFNAACMKANGHLLAHVSTADNARDLDLLRRAVGEETLSYYGTSYGSYLGATYINMFPQRVRAAVLDGAVAPAAWAGNAGEDLSLSTFIRIGSDLAAAAAVTDFLDRCGAAAPEACAFSAGSPEATRRKWDELLNRTRAGIALDGEAVDYRALTTYLQGALDRIDPLPGFARFPGWRAAAAFLQTAWEATEAPTGTPAATAPAITDATAPLTDAGASTDATPASPEPPAEAVYTTSAGRQLAVICGESPNPETALAAATQAIVSYQRAGISGWPFVAACVGWTARAGEVYSGPWNHLTPRPVLVIGNTLDPATPYASSERMAQELANARLLTVNGVGHTALFNPSRCAQDHVAGYLIDGTLPPGGTVCEQDRPPFAAR